MVYILLLLASNADLKLVLESLDSRVMDRRLRRLRKRPVGLQGAVRSCRCWGRLACSLPGGQRTCGVRVASDVRVMTIPAVGYRVTAVAGLPAVPGKCPEVLTSSKGSKEAHAADSRTECAPRRRHRHGAPAAARTCACRHRRPAARRSRPGEGRHRLRLLQRSSPPQWQCHAHRRGSEPGPTPGSCGRRASHRRDEQRR